VVTAAGVLNAVYPFAKRDQPDLLMTDLHLQRSPVLPAIRQLQNDPQTRDIPILVLTRSTEPAQLEVVMVTRATLVLPKLVNFDALRDSVITPA
jgi:CheY-like chemotaxis protein